MLTLRYGKVWLGLGGLMVVAVIVGSLLPNGPLPFDLDVNDKYLHFSTYFALMLWFSGMYGRSSQYLLIALVLIALGIGLDYLQIFIERRFFDKFDILANIIGTTIGCLMAIFLIGGWCRRVERLIVR